MEIIVPHKQIKIAIIYCYISIFLSLLKGLIYLAFPNYLMNHLQIALYTLIWLLISVAIVFYLRNLLNFNFGKQKLVPFFNWFIRIIIIVNILEITAPYTYDGYLGPLTAFLIILAMVMYIVLYVKIIMIKEYKEELKFLKAYAWLSLIFALLSGITMYIGVISRWNTTTLSSAYNFLSILPDLALILFYFKINSVYKLHNNLKDQHNNLAKNGI